MILQVSNPIVSTYGIFSYIYHKKSTKCRYVYHTWILWEWKCGPFDPKSPHLRELWKVVQVLLADCRGARNQKRRIQSYLDFPSKCVKFGAELHQKKTYQMADFFYISRRCRYSQMMIGLLNHLSIMLRFRETIPRKMIGLPRDMEIRRMET